MVLNRIIPQHIAVVMDGNGRWAESRGLPRIEGHKAGVAAVKRLIASCLEKKLPTVSLFAFSSENWSRPDQEVHFLMELFVDSLNKELSELNQHDIRLRFTGDRSPLSDKLQKKMQEAEMLTQKNDQLTLNIMVNYGGKWDIVTAAKKMSQAIMSGQLQLADVNEQVFAQFLDTDDLPCPDLFIRTSGELRISNFFLWQLAYTELYFTQTYWPDFDEQQLDLALDAFQARQRRFGKVV